MTSKKDIQSLIKNHSSRLQKLQERQALEGMEVAPHVLIEIEDIEKTLKDLQLELDKIDQAVEPDHITANLRQVSIRLEKYEQSAPSIPFWDRESYIDKMKAELGPAYYLLDAPAGYGKTELLRELKRRATLEGWICAYVCADDYKTSTELIKGLAWELQLQRSLTGDNTRFLGSNFGGLLRHERREDITQKGLILLIDLGRKTSLNLIRELVTEFIPGVQGSLQVDRFFKHEHNPFRVVLAGRHLAREKDKIESTPGVPLAVEQLPPLTYKGLLETTGQYLSKAIDPSVVTQIATEIMHITGGHPGCMASLLRLYRRTGELAPSDFFKFHRAEIQQIIDTEIGEVQEGIPAELQGAINILGIFRQVNLYILKFLINQKHIRDYINEVELGDRLTTAYYFKRDGPLLRNENHRLLGLRRREDPTCAQIAQRSCEDYLKETAVRRPETWVVEYLYQFLQSFSGEIEHPDKREEIHQALLQTELAHILSLLIAHMNQVQKRESYEALKQVLRGDDEFHFVVNYYTGRNQYSKEPYTQLQWKIDQFFREQGVGG